MGPWNTGTVVLDLVDPEGTGPPQVFAIDCNNLGISTKEQIRERRRVVAASIAPWCNCSVAVSGFLASIIAFPCLGGGVHDSRPCKRGERRLLHRTAPAGASILG